LNWVIFQHINYIMVSLKALQVSIFMYEVVSELMMVWCKYGRKVRDRARSSYGQGLVAKKKNLVGISRLNFYFLPYIFIFYIIFFKKKNWKVGGGGGHGPCLPPLPSVLWKVPELGQIRCKRQRFNVCK